MKIWVDTSTGTWGDAVDSIRVIEVTAEELDLIDGASDESIARFALSRPPAS